MLVRVHNFVLSRKLEWVTMAIQTRGQRNIGFSDQEGMRVPTEKECIERKCKETATRGYYCIGHGDNGTGRVENIPTVPMSNKAKTHAKPQRSVSPAVPNKGKKGGLKKDELAVGAGGAVAGGAAGMAAGGAAGLAIAGTAVAIPVAVVVAAPAVAVGLGAVAVWKVGKWFFSDDSQ